MQPCVHNCNFLASWILTLSLLREVAYVKEQGQSVMHFMHEYYVWRGRLRHDLAVEQGAKSGRQLKQLYT